MKLSGALVFGEENRFHEKDIYVRDGMITDEYAGYGEEIDASGCFAIPGLIDIHFHGALGYDVCDGTLEAFEKVAEYELRNGITSICPATLTLPADELKEILALGADFASKERGGCAELIGFNMEGPFISRAKKGAQNEDYIRRCDASLVREFKEASKGLLKIIGLAPEENPGFEEFIRQVKDAVKVSLAHTNADYDTANKAIGAGASHVVHLYNAMPEFLHRDPGVVGACFDSESVTAELICDGVHIHSSVVRNAFRVLSPDRIVMISDSLRCAGMPDGSYVLGGLPVEKMGKYCRLKDGGNIAGSVSNLYDCLVTVTKEMGVSLEQAVAACTINPARCIGALDMYGTLQPGKYADIVLLDKDTLSLRAVFKKGRRI